MGKSKLLILALLLAALGGLAWFFVTSGGEPAPIGPIAGGGDPNPSAINAPLRGEGQRGDAADAHGGRIEMEAPVDSGVPASYREALAGFQGRVLHHNGDPAPQHRVLLFRFDLDAVIGPDVDMFSEASYTPEIDCGDTRTDDEGRFEIRGVFPRGFFLVQAGVGSDNPTAKVVQRVPGPGELVDLGDIRLKDGAIITGQVLGEDGKPLAGALVRATDLPGQVLSFVPLDRFDPEGAVIVAAGGTKLVAEMPSWAKTRFEQLPIAATRSASDGRFRLTGIDAGDNVLIVTAPAHSSFINPRLKLKAGEERDVGEIGLKLGEEVYGKVVDEQNRPVAGADVLIGQGGPAVPVSLASHYGPTDAKGAFVASGFKPGKVIGAARRSRFDPWMISDEQPAGQDMIIRLPGRHSLTLRLTSSASLAIERPEFRLIPGVLEQGAVDMGMWGVKKPVRLDGRVNQGEDGRFRIDDIDSGKYALLVRSAGHAVSMLDVDLTHDSEHTVVLHAQNAFEVVVTDLRNKPVADAAIYVMGRSHPRVPSMPLHCGVTGRDGHLLVDRAGSKEIVISASHPKYGRIHDQVTLPLQEVRLQFDDPGVLEGVLTEGGQTPEPGKWSIAIAPSGQDRAALPQLPRLAVADVEGNFRVTGLSPGSYSLSVLKSLDALSSPGAVVAMGYRSSFFDSDETSVEISANQTTRANIDAIKRPEIVEGPSANVSGSVMLDGRPGRGLMITGWGNGQRLLAKVEDNGTFDLGQVKEGHVSLQLSDPENVSLSGRSRLWERNFKVEANKPVVLDIDVQRGALSGTVYLVDGSPAASIEVRAQGVVRAAVGTDSKDQASASAQELTDDRGNFEFTAIPAGTYVLNVNDKRGHGRSEVEVVAGVPRRGTEIRLQRVFSVSGNVDMSVFGKQPYEWAWMQFVSKSGSGSQDRRWANLAKDGSFTAETMLPGRYEIELTAMTRRPGTENEHDQQQYEADPIDVDGDVTGLTLHLRLRKPPEPKPKKQ